MTKKLIHSRFELIAVDYSANVAIATESSTYTYHQLNTVANQVAGILIKSGLTGSPVGLFMQAGFSYIAGFLGVAKSNNLLMPIDPSHPESRLISILERVKPKIFFTSNAKETQSLINYIDKIHADSGDIEIYQIDESEKETAIIHKVSGGQKETIVFNPDELQNPDLDIDPNNSIYLIYTSGSTGTPKIIEGKHKSLDHFIHWEKKIVKTEQSIKTCLLAPITFDVSFRDILLPLTSGGIVNIPSEETKSSSILLLKFFEKFEVSALHAVPSLLRVLSKELKESVTLKTTIRSLEYILLAGEALFGRDVINWRKYSDSPAQLVNLYGPSESTLAKVFYQIKDTDELKEQEIIKLGSPIDNTAILIIKNNRLCEIGEIGEICIKTPFLSAGYYDDEQLTSEKFVQNPLHTEFEDKVYKSGDLGKYDADRSILYIGRMDQQVKIRGNRVELGDIESTLLEHPQVEQVVVTSALNDDNEVKLSCYYIGSESIGNDAVIKYLTERLPDYMVPQYFMEMEEFPLNLNGKVNRKALPEISNSVEEQYSPVIGDTEIALEEIWKGVLKMDRIGRDASFFNLGGSSLNAIQVISRIFKNMEVKIGLKDIFANRTIAELAKCVDSHRKEQFSHIPKAPEAKYYPLSSAQKRLWVLSQVEGNGIAYNLTDAYRFEGELKTAEFDKAVKEVISKHESLRTIFESVEGEPKQRILDADEIKFEPDLIDLESQGLTGDEKDRFIVDYLSKEAFKEIRLDQAPLFRTTLIKQNDDENIFVFTLHHIIADGWSMRVMIDDVIEVYNALIHSKPYSLKELRIQFKDYAVWEQNQLNSGILKEQKEYWRSHLGNELPVVDFPTDFPRPAVRTVSGRKVSKSYDGTLLTKLKNKAASGEMTLYMLLVSAVNLLVNRYSGQSKVVLGMPTAGRVNSDLEEQIGFFINNLPLILETDNSQLLDDYLNSVKTEVTNAFDHQQYPYGNMIEDMSGSTDRSRTPLFDIVVVLQNAAQSQKEYIEFEDIKISQLKSEVVLSLVDLHFEFVELEGNLTFNLTYNPDLFTDERMKSVCHHLELVFTVISEGQNLPVAEIGITSEEEQKLLRTFENGSSEVLTDCTNLVDEFEKVVSVNSDNPATIFYHESYSYHQLNRKANQLARLIRSKVNEKSRVGVFMNEGSWNMAAFWGILKANCIYVPIEKDLPAERRKFIISDAKPAAIVTDSDLMLDLTDYSGQIFVADIQLEMSEEPDDNPSFTINADDIAYMIYTSGSTGMPKGVLVPHSSVLNMALNQIRLFGLSENERVLQFAASSFDASISEFLMALLSGNSLVMIKKSLKSDKEALLKYMEQNEVTNVTFPPSFLKLFAPDELSFLNVIITAGEATSPQLARDFSKHSRYFNAYGPTECAVCVSLFQYQNETDIVNGQVPIGKPLPNTSVKVLDERMNEVPVGVNGRLFVSGKGLATGYFERPELTDEKFIDNPFREGTRLYDTGDVVRWDSAGNLIFQGRSDDQMKVRGFRIEPGEIKNQLLQTGKVNDVAIQWRGEGNNGRLIAFTKESRKIELWPSLAEYLLYDDILYKTMSEDEYRNEQYRKALRSKIEGKTVLEIGPGSQAILSRICIECGAAKVVAVEILEEAYQKATKKVAELGLSDKIEIIHGDILKVELTEKFDYCVSEIVGSIGGSEGAAILINRARKFLKNPAAMVPSKSITRIAAVSLPKDTFVPAFEELGAYYVDKIFEHHGRSFDLRLCLDGITQEEIISDNGVFEWLDFTAEITPEVSHETNLRIEKDKVCHGFVIWLDLFLDEDHHVDSLVDKGIWLPIYLPVFPKGIQLNAGDTVQMEVTRTISKNGLNPDFVITGAVSNAEDDQVVPFTYECSHISDGFAENEFYRSIFNGQIPKVNLGLDVQELKNQIGKFLPDYMIPDDIITVSEIPLNVNGKVDFEKLSDQLSGKVEKTVRTEPADAIEKAVVNVWKSVLELEDVSVADNFFEIGGNSLKATQVISALRKEVDLPITLNDLFANLTAIEMANYLRRQSQEQFLEIPAVENKASYQLSNAQRRLWLTEQVSKEKLLFNGVGVYFFNGKLDKEIFKKALDELISKYEILRTTFKLEEGQPVQVIDSQLAIESIYNSEKSEGGVDLKALAEQLSTEELSREFDLENGPLINARLIEKNEEEHLFVFSIHHIITDGWSMHIILREVCRLYNTLTSNGQVSEEPLRIQYKDFAEWEYDKINSGGLASQKEYWLKQFENPVPQINFPTDYPRPEIRQNRGGKYHFEIESDLFEAIKEGSENYNVTRFMWLTAVYYTLISRYSGQKDLVIGTPIAGRDHPDLEDQIGVFINALPLRVKIEENNSFAQLLNQVKKVSLGAFSNQNYPFDRLIEDLEVPRSNNRSPLFDMVIVLQDINNEKAQLPGLGEVTVESYETEFANIALDIRLVFETRKEKIIGFFEYDKSLFSEGTIARLTENYLKILRAVSERPSMDIEEIKLSGQSDEKLAEVKTSFNF